jgi:hypothetical protein
MSEKGPEIVAEASPGKKEPGENAGQNKESFITEPSPEKSHKHHHRDKHGARLVFNLFNFLGLHWVGNSSLSLWITYNLLPHKAPQRLMDTLSNAAKPIATATDVITGPLKKAFGAIKKSFGLKHEVQELTEAMREERIAHNARSFVETLCMCVAGSVILLPVKWLEDHKPKILTKIDGWLHPGKKTDPAKDAAPEHEHKETWTNLIRARLVSLIPIFIIDNQLQRFNNRRFEQKLHNLDTWEWTYGAKFFDKMEGSKWRDRIVEFFARKNVALTGIQPMVRKHLLESIDSPQEIRNLGDQLGKLQEGVKHAHKNPVLESRLKAEINELNASFLKTHPHLKSDVERAVFAEQSRLFTKEVGLTLVYTGFLFLIGKTKFAAHALEKLHLKRKEFEDDDHTVLVLPDGVALDAVTNGVPAQDVSGESWAKHVVRHQPAISEPKTSFTENLKQQAETSLSV